MQSEIIPASMEYLSRVMSLTEEELRQAGCGEKDRRLIEISVEEIFTNIASYAYGGGEGVIRIRWDIRQVRNGQKEAVICFADEGTPYNPFARKDPDLTLPMEQRPVGGLGVYMVKQFMDETDYRCEKGRNVTVIKKRVPGE